MGVYQFMEKLKRDQNRIDIEKLTPLDTDAAAITGGYIIKIDKTAGGENGIGQPLEYFDNNWGDDALYTATNSWRSQYDIFKQPINFTPYRAPYHPDQYLETYFLYEYPKADQIPMPKKSTYKAIFTTLKRRSLMMILPQMRVPIQTILTWIVL
jgi:hypothetical protein